MARRNEKEMLDLMKKRILIITILGFIMSNFFLLLDIGFENLGSADIRWGKYILGVIIFTGFFSGIITPVYAYIARRSESKKEN